MEKIAVCRLPTKWGLFQAYCYQSKLDGTEHIAVVKVLIVSRHLPFNLQLRKKKGLNFNIQLCSFTTLYVHFAGS